MGAITTQEIDILDLWIMSTLYGIYVVIFAVSIYLLVLRRQSAVDKLLLLVTVALFTICTTQNITYFVSTFLSTSVLPSGKLKHEKLVDIVFCIVDSLNTTNNLIADGLLIWRCYVVWGRRYIVILIPMIMLIAGTVCGYIAVGLDVKIYLDLVHAPLAPVPVLLNNLYDYITIAFYATSFVTNITMSLLIAGRIWWTTRESRQYFGRSHGKRYYRVASLIVESGAVYSLFLLLEAIFVSIPYNTVNFSATSDVIQATRSMLVGIVPTLIIVLVALGSTSDQTTFSSNDIMEAHATLSKSIEFATPNIMDRHGQSQTHHTHTHTIDLQISEIRRTDEDIERGFAEKSISRGEVELERDLISEDNSINDRSALSRSSRSSE